MIWLNNIWKGIKKVFDRYDDKNFTVNDHNLMNENLNLKREVESLTGYNEELMNQVEVLNDIIQDLETQMDNKCNFPVPEGVDLMRGELIGLVQSHEPKMFEVYDDFYKCISAGELKEWFRFNRVDKERWTEDL